MNADDRNESKTMRPKQIKVVPFSTTTKPKWSSKNKLLRGIGIGISTVKEVPRPSSTCNKLSGISHDCLICNKKFKSKYHLGRHMFSHKKESNYTCTICDKAFPSNDVLIIHERSHTNQLPFACTEDKCSKKYPSSSSLHRHLLTHKDNQLCEECGKSFHSITTLRIHLGTHTLERKYNCNQCRLRFRRRVDLKRHKLTHAVDFQVLPCPLPQCEHQFRRKDNLIRHLRLTHNQSKEEANDTFNLVNASWKGSECNGSNVESAPQSVSDVISSINTPISICDKDFENEPDLESNNPTEYHRNFDNSATEKSFLTASSEASPNLQTFVNRTSVTTSVIRLADSSAEHRNHREKELLDNNFAQQNTQQSYYDINHGEVFMSSHHSYSANFSNNHLNHFNNHSHYNTEPLRPIHPIETCTQQTTSFQPNYRSPMVYSNLIPVSYPMDDCTTEYLDLSNSRRNEIPEDFNYNSSSSSYNGQADFPQITSHNQIQNGQRHVNVPVIRRASHVIHQSIVGANINKKDVKDEFNASHASNDSLKQNGETSSSTISSDEIKLKIPGKDPSNLPYFTRDPRKNFLWENFSRHNKL